MRESRGKDRILVVDEDPDVLDLLERQVLTTLGYDVDTASDAGAAIQQALSQSPNLILASLTLPGLSGKDLLVALRSQGMDIPILVMAPEGMEADAIQAFRLGAADYLVKPLREAEAVAAVERAFKEVRLQRERQNLAQRLEVSNKELERRVRELTTLYGLGKVVTSTTRQADLFSKLMEGSLFVTEAEMGWLLLQDEETEQLVLRAQRNLPSPLAGKLHQAWDDGVSSLVMLSGEPLAIHGEGLAKFKMARIAKAALIVPIKVRGQPIGVITVARKQAEEFDERNQAMLEAAADYASISLVNARLFQALEARAQQLQRLVDDTRSVMQTQKDWLYAVGQGIRTAQSQIIRLSTETKDSTAKAQMKLIARDLQSLLGQLESQPRSAAEDRSGHPAEPQG